MQAPVEFRYLRVTQVYTLAREKGMFNFPCFEVDESVGHGFSGGPVFYENRLCGVVSGASSFVEQSWIASLWPLALMEYSDEFDRLTAFGELLDRGAVVAADWLEIRHRISKGVDSFGQPYLSMESG